MTVLFIVILTASILLLPYFIYLICRLFTTKEKACKIAEDFMKATSYKQTID